LQRSSAARLRSRRVASCVLHELVDQRLAVVVLGLREQVPIAASGG
jgi:hypothetical protein